MSDDFQVVSSEVLLKSYVFNVERRLIRHGDTTFERDVATHLGAVAVLVINDREEIGLLRQYRATFDRFGWEVPAGICDVDDEIPLEAAQRELEEEMGCQARTWNLLGRFAVSPGWTTQVMTIFEARDLTFTNRAPIGPEESASSVHWLTKDQIREIVFGDEIVDSTLTMMMNRVFGTLFDRS
ncbi:MAG TPA: NUDIX hydrolase [Acidimicrobiales bacterium]